MKEKPKNNNQDEKSGFIRRVNVFIRRSNRKEVLTFLLFVFIAAFFWMVQTSREETSSEYTVELRIDAQPQDVVFTTHVPQRLKVTLSDTNMRLMNYSFKSTMKRLTVNFDRYADAAGDFRISAAELQSLLREELQSTTRIVAVSPSLVDARFALTEGRRFAVNVNGTYLPDENYRIRKIIIEPDSVTINAPTAVLDTMKWVLTNHRSYTQLRDTLTEVMEFDLPLGVKATPSKVKITVPVAQYVEKVFDRIVVRTEHEPEHEQLIVFPYAVRLSCLVDCEFFRTISEEDFIVTVDYDDLAFTTDPEHLPLHVRYVGPPEVVTNITLSPAQAEFVLEKH